MSQGWIGVDFDGTIATYYGWRGELEFGEPVKKMVDRVRNTLALGYEVRIFTARVSQADQTENDIVRTAIQDWLEKAGLPRLAVTNVKDYQMVELWDDRAVQVTANTGEFVGASTRGFV